MTARPSRPRRRRSSARSSRPTIPRAPIITCPRRAHPRVPGRRRCVSGQPRPSPRGARAHARRRAGAVPRAGADLAGAGRRSAGGRRRQPDLQLAGALPAHRRPGDRIETRPIKGTRPRVDDEVQNGRAAAELVASVKDTAEHLMIVDLERSDLGRIAQLGSVTVEELGYVVGFSTVLHRVSRGCARAGAGHRPRRAFARHLPGRLDHRCPQGARHADHRRARAGAPRPVLRRPGLPFARASSIWPSPSAPACSPPASCASTSVAASSRTPIRAPSWPRPRTRLPAWRRALASLAAGSRLPPASVRFPRRTGLAGRRSPRNEPKVVHTPPPPRDRGAPPRRGRSLPDSRSCVGRW